MDRLKNRAAAIHFGNGPVALLLLVMLLSGSIISQRAFFSIYVDEVLGFSAVIVSTFVSLGMVWGMVAALVGGALSDAVGRKGTLALGLVGLALSTLAFLTDMPWLVLLFWAIGGLGLGFHSLGGMGYLIDAARPEHLGVSSALYHLGYTLGGALSSPAAGYILDNHGFDTFGLILLTLSVAMLLVAFLFLPRIERETDGETPSIGKTLLGYRKVIRRPPVTRLGLMRFLPTCYYGMIVVLNPLLINRMTGSKTAVALYITTSSVLATLAQVVVGRAADRWGSRRPTLVTYSILVCAIVGQGIFATQLWSYYVFGVLGIAAAWSLSTLMPVLIAESTDVEERGRVMGALDILWNLAMIGGAMIGGALLELAMGLPFAVVAVLNVAAIAVAVSFFRLVQVRRVEILGVAPTT